MRIRSKTRSIAFGVLIVAALSGVFAACADTSAPTVTTPSQAAKVSAHLSSTVYCNGNNYCYSDGAGAAGTQQLTVTVFAGCLHGHLQEVPGDCHPHAGNIGGGAPGATYSIRYYESICRYDGSCDPQFEIPSPPTIHFNSDTYEIDVTAQVAEIGGTELTGEGIVQDMGPASVEGSGGLEAPCPSNSGSMFDPFPFRAPAIDPATGQQMRDSNGNLLYKYFGRTPCTGDIAWDPGQPRI
jgi:hypothetical protein